MRLFRKVPANHEPEYIVVHGSDSEPEPLQTERAPKRQKSNRSPGCHQNTIMSMEMGSASNNEKNAHLKGRRRYNADLEDLKEECSDGLVYHGYRVKKFRAGDDEGSIELVICNSHGSDILGLNLLVSDTSDYPKSHSFFSYSNDAELSINILNIVESISSWPSQPIRQTVQKVLTSLAQPNDSAPSPQFQVEDVDMEDDESSDYEAFDEFDTVNENTTSVDKINLQKMQNDFIETIATGYRPGVIHFGGDDFAISISLPVVTLAKSIPPRALMAWDRRLLSRSQHLTLLISGFRGMYYPITADGTYGVASQQAGTALTFKVGLSKKYKPGKEHAKDAGRTFGLILQDTEDQLRVEAEKAAALEADYEYNSDSYAEPGQPEPVIEPEEEEDEGRFDRFSLSSSLESLLDHTFLKVIQLRRRFGLGWAGAEVLFAEIEKRQVTAVAVLDTMRSEILAADEEEMKFSRTNGLPHDPLLGLEPQREINLPLTAFCYLIRRLLLCTRYCIVCHNKLNSVFEALKPYVCDSKLCAYQYYSLNRGPSLEYEIVHNPQTVDLLVSIAHSAASEGAMDEPLPTGLALRVPIPDPIKVREAPMPQHFNQPSAAMPSVLPVSIENIARGPDGLCDFDDLNIPMMRASIVEMIDSLPAIEDMKKHLEKKVKAGRAKPKLRDMEPNIIPAAWSILRWCVASCTAYIEEITSGEESIKNMDPGWRQFRFSVGAPNAEAKFKAAVTDAQAKDVNALRYPSLYAFHGSPLRNWHSIIRHGLWYKSIANGRAYGNGVYLAKEGQLSMGSYAQPGRSTWRKSRTCPSSCVALAEIVNLPREFVSNNPYFVIKDTHWIVCRYLLVKGAIEPTNNTTSTDESSTPTSTTATPQVKLDPAHPITLNGKRIEIPEPSYQIDTLLKARQEEYSEEDNDEEDVAIFTVKTSIPEVIDIDSDEEYDMDYDDGGRASVPKEPAVSSVSKMEKPANDWKHHQDWVTESIQHLMPPPLEATPSATLAVQRELRAVLKEQENAKSLKDLGWYMPPDLIGDNLFQWIVELHSFDDTLPIAKDMKSKGLNSVIFEIRFPPAFPISPPFFRIVTPRFLPFIHGGGGHVTGGGSICMDLLTSSGWLPSYSIAAVLMQIKLAISNLDPKPARLSSDFNRPYGVHEALEGYKRAAATHGWQVPVGIEKLVR